MANHQGPEVAGRRVRFLNGAVLDADELEAFGDELRRGLERLRRDLIGRGIVAGIGAELAVTVVGGEGWELEVGRGLAIDGEGRELRLEQPRRIAIPHDLRGAGRLWLCARAVLREEGWFEDAERPEVYGHRRLREDLELELHTGPEALHEGLVELARVRLTEASGLRDPVRPEAPVDGELDRRQVLFIHPAGRGLRPSSRRAWEPRLAALREALRDSAGRTEALEARVILNQLRIGLRIGRLDVVELAASLGLVAELLEDRARRRGRFEGALRRRLRALAAGEASHNPAALDELAGQVDALTLLLAGDPGDSAAEPSTPAAAPSLAERLAQLPRVPEMIESSEGRWLWVDELTIGDPESERAHDWSGGGEPELRTRRFAGGEVLTARGRGITDRFSLRFGEQEDARGSRLVLLLDESAGVCRVKVEVAGVEVGVRELGPTTPREGWRREVLDLGEAETGPAPQITISVESGTLALFGVTLLSADRG